jgi:hypothetical protein
MYRFSNGLTEKKEKQTRIAISARQRRKEALQIWFWNVKLPSNAIVRMKLSDLEKNTNSKMTKTNIYNTKIAIFNCCCPSCCQELQEQSLAIQHLSSLIFWAALH